MPKISIELNKPIEGALAYDKGKFGESKYPGGDYYTYTLVSGDVMFLEQRICDEPDELFRENGVGQGDPFRLTLRKSRTGGKYYEVHRLTPLPEPEPEPSQLERQLTASIEQHVQDKRQAQPAKVAPTATAGINQQHQRQSNPTPAPTHVGQTRASAAMAAAMVCAIDALAIAQQYASSRGIHISFGPEDIRTTAATIYIQACKDPLFMERTAAGGAEWRQ
jgi:hypothetical protein